MRSWIWLCALAALLMLVPSAPKAQDYPSRPIRAVLPFSPGGLGDTVIRAIGHGLTQSLGRGVVVQNRPGGGTQIGAQACATAAPDGYTFCMLPVDAMSYQPFLTKNLPYDPDKSFEPITAVFYLTEVIVVNPATKVSSIAELIALSRARPNTLNYATTATSSILFFENFKHETGADITKVVYKGGADAVNAMLSGESQVGFFGLGNVVGQIESGALKALAVDGERRSPLLPNVPTLTEAGYKGAQNRVWFGLFAPAGTPKPVVTKLQSEVARVVREAEFTRKYMTGLGLEPILNSPEQFAQLLREDRARAELLVKRSGLQMQ
jgi:tripartite-type tricarboxylate transporter receptor subunit TctC